MKKIIAVLLCCVLLSVNAYAADELPDVENEEIEYLEDGSCFVTITEIVSDGSIIRPFSTSTVRSGKKTIIYRSASGSKLWEVSVKGTFSYNGKKATCTKSAVSTKCYSSSWKVSNASASKSGSQATAKATGTQYKGGKAIGSHTKMVILTCSKDGKLS